MLGCFFGFSRLLYLSFFLFWMLPEALFLFDGTGTIKGESCHFCLDQSHVDIFSILRADPLTQDFSLYRRLFR
jgi:hypothetical protein